MLLVVHIPKTAGTSLRLALEKSFGLARVARDYGPQSEYTTEAVRRHMYQNRSKSSARQLVSELENAGYAALMGHFPYSRYGRYFERDRVIAFVREPLQRSCSEYLHQARNGTFQGTFEEFMQMPAQQNLQARFLNGYSGETFLGLTEQYKSSIQLLNERFELKLKSKKVNVGLSGGGVRHMESLGSELTRQFYDLNSKDLKLYGNLMKKIKLQQQESRRQSPFLRKWLGG
jgi:hypothetical protein